MQRDGWLFRFYNYLETKINRFFIFLPTLVAFLSNIFLSRELMEVRLLKRKDYCSSDFVY